LRTAPLWLRCYVHVAFSLFAAYRRFAFDFTRQLLTLFAVYPVVTAVARIRSRFTVAALQRSRFTRLILVWLLRVLRSASYHIYFIAVLVCYTRFTAVPVDCLFAVPLPFAYLRFCDYGCRLRSRIARCWFACLHRFPFHLYICYVCWLWFPCYLYHVRVPGSFYVRLRYRCLLVAVVLLRLRSAFTTAVTVLPTVALLHAYTAIHATVVAFGVLPLQVH